MMSVLAAVEHWALTMPERNAQESGRRTLTYRQLWTGANAVAARLVQMGLTPGSPIVVRGHKEPEAIIGFLAASLAGHPYVPVDSGVPNHRCRVIAEEANAEIVLNPEDVEAFASSGGIGPIRSRATDDVQYVMFTSGSTGRPKGVPITGGNLAHFLRWMLAEHGFVPGQRFLDQAVYSFDLSVMSLYPSLVTGGTLVSLPSEDVADPARLFRTLAGSSLSVWVSTPTFVQLCLAERTFAEPLLPRLERFLFCGETLPATTARALLDRFPSADIWNTYGPTEATVATTSVRIDRPMLDRFESVPIGRAAPRARVEVVDGTLVPLPDGERGELLIAGPSVSPGYLHPDASHERSFVRWEGQRAYRTGDQGHRTEGLLFFDGRTDNQVKLHGYRIELGDVEAGLRDIPGVLGAAVVVTSKNGAPDALAAFVMLSPGQPRSPDGSVQFIRTSLAERLPRYMIPRRIRVLDALPMTVNGKLDRRALTSLAR
jgi:D-alanine--poly(phosphoribitol) ligase subunit 1